MCIYMHTPSRTVLDLIANYPLGKPLHHPEQTPRDTTSLYYTVIDWLTFELWSGAITAEPYGP